MIWIIGEMFKARIMKKGKPCRLLPSHAALRALDTLDDLLDTLHGGLLFQSLSILAV